MLQARRGLSRVRQRLAGNRILLWVCLVIAVNQLGFGIIVPVTPIYARTFGVSEVAIGLVVAVYGLGRFLFSAPTGKAADRFGRKRTIFAGTILTCVGSLLCGLATDFTQLLIYRFIAGIGSTAVITGTQIVVADVATRENRGRMMSTYQGFFAFVVGVGPSIGGVVALLAGPRAPFFVFALLTLVAGAIALTQLPETSEAHKPAVLLPDPAQPPQPVSPFESMQPALTHAGHTPALPAGPPETRSVVRQLLTNVGFLCVALVTFQHAFTRTGALFSVVPLMGVERIGLDPAAIGFALTTGNLLNLGVITLAGVLVDRYGRKPVIVPSCLLSACAFVGFAFAPDYPTFVLSAVLWGIGSALGGSAGAYAADQAPPGGNGVTMGIYRTLSDAGYVLGPVLLGLVAAGAGAQASLLTAAAVAIVAMLPFALFAPETPPRTRVAPGPA
ncbi:MAG TPA: MFS transporter [Chloroflexota bacterium]|nr:MFS transporter [Chloroflexota bacterium]